MKSGRTSLVVVSLLVVGYMGVPAWGATYTNSLETSAQWASFSPKWTESTSGYSQPRGYNGSHSGTGLDYALGEHYENNVYCNDVAFSTEAGTLAPLGGEASIWSLFYNPDYREGGIAYQISETRALGFTYYKRASYNDLLRIVEFDPSAALPVPTGLTESELDSQQQYRTWNQVSATFVNNGNDLDVTLSLYDSAGSLVDSLSSSIVGGACQSGYGKVGIYSRIEGAQQAFNSFNEISITPVPEPVTMMFLALGGLLLRKRSV
jgi:hypothetical protein